MKNTLWYGGIVACVMVAAKLDPSSLPFTVSIAALVLFIREIIVTNPVTNVAKPVTNLPSETSLPSANPLK